ncbi:hypothetical protein KC669_00430 [Candidatus Dojkabacteria bacterium]|uniref:Uncharacterized protein n=1 Tax=Candidatus Dojkabacteria bacterium TaxID=2099670 RepID=A0A955L986_9BACT|nr:hypothetical protein [Candidatus Dojkabacteria bacterium]
MDANKSFDIGDSDSTEIIFSDNHLYYAQLNGIEPPKLNYQPYITHLPDSKPRYTHTREYPHYPVFVVNRINHSLELLEQVVSQDDLEVLKDLFRNGLVHVITERSTLNLLDEEYSPKNLLEATQERYFRITFEGIPANEIHKRYKRPNKKDALMQSGDEAFRIRQHLNRIVGSLQIYQPIESSLENSEEYMPIVESLISQEWDDESIQRFLAHKYFNQKPVRIGMSKAFTNYILASTGDAELSPELKRALKWNCFVSAIASSSNEFLDPFPLESISDQVQSININVLPQIPDLYIETLKLILSDETLPKDRHGRPVFNKVTSLEILFEGKNPPIFDLVRKQLQKYIQTGGDGEKATIIGKQFQEAYMRFKKFEADELRNIAVTDITPGGNSLWLANPAYREQYLQTIYGRKGERKRVQTPFSDIFEA